MIPSVSKRWSSFSTFSRKAYGTGRALQSLGMASGSRYNFASIPSAFVALAGTRTHALVVLHLEIDLFACNNSFQFNWMCFSQTILSRVGPDPCTTSIDRTTCCASYFTSNAKCSQYNKSLSRIRTEASSGRFQLWRDRPEFTVRCLTH